ncbi:MAG: sulfurtransferase complex subunit TusB [Pseudomonadales bacterium]|jgi:tRNA 2-thiouridine synthesizing protein B|nr:sulfurtransferase complex subunit TusB [Pseudomonadales bacterium]
MATLHLVNHSPARSDALAACLAVLRPGDGLLLFEDGVLAALHADLRDLPADIRLFALDADARARGLAARLDERIERVDHAGFVAACAAHERVVSWA